MAQHENNIAHETNKIQFNTKHDRHIHMGSQNDEISMVVQDSGNIYF